MEEIGGNIHGRVCYKSQHHLPIFMDEKLQNTFWTRQHEYITSPSPDKRDVLGSPVSAMEYLSRSWSPETSNFLQLFSTNNFQLSLGDSSNRQLREEDLQSNNQNAEDHEDLQTEEARELAGAEQALIAIDKHHKTYQKKASARSWLNLTQIKGWFRSTTLLRWSKERTREELRLQTAKVDAAVSVAQLAAAVAGFTGTNTIGAHRNTCHIDINGAMVPHETDTANAVSFAAALVAAACAEAAEMAGAPKKHVASAINSGFATQTQADMATLTAAAATCLRGATTLRSRTTIQERKELLTSVTPIPVLPPSGNKRHRLVSIHIKCNQLLLRLTKKYLGSVLTSREYTILDMMGESSKAQGYYMVSLQTDGGHLKLLFQNEKQKLTWMSTIYNFLQKSDVGRINII